LRKLDKETVQCELCPRLIKHCNKIAKDKRKSYLDWEYWGKPVANFGDYNGSVLIVGLAPAAHGANRTGRMFTGDRSGDWLYRALHKSGFANQAKSSSVKDGLKLKNALVTAVAHCAPPDNKPTREEIQNCEPFLIRTFESMKKLRVVLALGNIGWSETFRYFKAQELWSGATPKFGHGAEAELDNGLIVIGSYHPSQQNTFTKRLTEPMFDSIFNRINEVI